MIQMSYYLVGHLQLASSDSFRPNNCHDVRGLEAISMRYKLISGHFLLSRFLKYMATKVHNVCEHLNITFGSPEEVYGHLLQLIHLVERMDHQMFPFAQITQNNLRATFRHLCAS